MRIHHLNCSTFCPLGGHFTDRISPGLKEGHLVCHCLLVETHEGLVLIDTGLGMKDVFRPQDRMSSLFRGILRPKLDAHETAARQIRAIGFRPSDVRHIILTHLDFDHAGGIDDFPQAEVHVMESELKAATNPQGFISRRRYQPSQLTHAKTWNTYYAEGEKWFGFDSVRQLKGLPPEILMVPLAGHTEGHAGIAVNTDEGWLLHAGDAYFFRGEINHDYSCPTGLRAYQKMMEVNHKLRVLNQMKLRDLAHDHHGDVRIFSAHDAIEFEDLKKSEPRLLAGTSDNFENVLWMRNKQEPKSLQ
ncbi:MAG: MBL fold metallo-hydrolase [Bdellovibrionales bacterium]|nr:MBL fold metallo-hydrolase [Bdellovibrionales bacterium]